MFRRFFREKPSVLDEPIEQVLTEMNKHGIDSPEYKQLITHLEKLVLLKREEQNNKISKDTALIVAGNLVGILIIVAYEQRHVMVSKGLGFLLRTNHPTI